MSSRLRQSLRPSAIAGGLARAESRSRVCACRRSSSSRPVSATLRFRRRSPTPRRCSAPAGYEVEFPARQVCCGQPAFNSGHRAAARRVARSFAKAFSRELPVVDPSGSCATMASHYLPGAARGRAVRGVGAVGVPRRTRASGRCRATTGAASPTTTRATCFASSRISAQPRRLLGASGAELVPFARPDLCCGFGGTFSVRQPEVSLAMADDKLAGAPTAGTIVTADPGCLMHLRGRAEKRRVAGSGRASRDRARAGVSVPELAQPAAALPRDRAREARRRAHAGGARQRDEPAADEPRRGLGGARRTSRRCGSARTDPDGGDRRPRRRTSRGSRRRSRRAAATSSSRGRRRRRARTSPTCARGSGAKLAAKSKSMATEEIGLNEALEAVGRRAGRDRPRRVHPPARRRAPGAHHRAGDREDGRAGGRAALGGRRRATIPPELEALTNAARRQLRETFLTRGRRDHRRQLRRLVHRVDLPGHERGQRATRQLDPARARGADGDGAARADDRRPRPCC